MKSFLLLAIFAVISLQSFASYADPPIQEVRGHNNAIANSLLGFVPAGGNGFDNCAIVENPSGMGTKAVEFISVRAISLFPAIDARISADTAPAVFWTYGERHKNSISWETTLGGTTCTSSADFVGFFQTTEAHISFMNVTASVQANSNPFQLPSSITNALNKTDGNSMLEGSISGTAIFTYDADVYAVVCTEHTGCSCEKNALASGKKNVTFSCSNTISYLVEGGGVLQFLARPPLKEQWFRNNRFDNLLLSKRKFYKGDVLLNNEIIGNFSLYFFDVMEDGYGLRSIKSAFNYAPDALLASEHEEKSTPLQLEKTPESFTYVYEINSSYAGIGWNTLLLRVHDHFGKKFEWNEEILSRQLSFEGNKSETGGDDEARPSVQWQTGDYSLLLISGGIIGIFIIVVLYRS